MTTRLSPGATAPPFILPDSDGKAVSLGDLRGRWVVLYFYPRDNTSGCTTEALDFTALAPEFNRRKATIIGISPDSCESHARFMLKHDLGITLLSDKGRDVLKQYGAWQLKKLYGKETYGVVRSTFLIDGEGIIRHVWDKVKVAGHAEQVLVTLREMTR
jgi:peroxiredoxin Q/BCP